MLYKVEIETTMYVVANDEIEAENIAHQNIEEESRNSSYLIDAVSEVHQIENIWRDCYPYCAYGENQNKTCEEYLKDQNEEPTDVSSVKLGGVGKCIHCDQIVPNKSYHESRCGRCKLNNINEKE